jgi:hypothetical protein
MRKTKEAAAEAISLLDRAAAAPTPAEKEDLENQVWNVCKDFLSECLIELQSAVKTRNARSDAVAIAIFREFEQRWLAFLNRLTGKLRPAFQEGLRDQFKSGAALIFGLRLARAIWPHWTPSDADQTTESKKSPWASA